MQLLIDSDDGFGGLIFWGFGKDGIVVMMVDNY
jgi:hypothetical protein